MVKNNVVIPKGFKCKNGVCTTEEMELEIEIPDEKPIITRIQELQITSPNNSQQLIQQEPKKEIKEIEKLIKVVPSWMPNYICKGPNCNTKKNPAYTSAPKGKCSNCGQFTKEAFGTCIWCQSKEIEQLDEDELNNLGIPSPDDNKPDSEEAD